MYENIWVFYKKDFIIGPDEQRGHWEQITHCQAQDRMYEHGIRCATTEIKRMMKWGHPIMLTGTIIKMERHPWCKLHKV